MCLVFFFSWADICVGRPLIHQPDLRFVARELYRRPSPLTPSVFVLSFAGPLPSAVSNLRCPCGPMGLNYSDNLSSPRLRCAAALR